MSILDGLAGIVGSALGPVFYPAVLTQRTQPASSPARDPWNPATPTETQHACLALFTRYDEKLRRDGSAKESDRKTLILQSSLPAGVVPAPNDTVTIAKFGETTLCLWTSTDPARACWVLHSELSSNRGG